MKSTTALLAVIIAFTCFSCKKERTEPQLAGKWQLVEVNAAYANGGNFQWQQVPSSETRTIEFHTNGSFEEQTSGATSPDYCNGSYELLGSRLKLYSTCNTSDIDLGYQNTTASQMILSHVVREGMYHEKYVKIN